MLLQVIFASFIFITSVAPIPPQDPEGLKMLKMTWVTELCNIFTQYLLHLPVTSDDSENATDRCIEMYKQIEQIRNPLLMLPSNGIICNPSDFKIHQMFDNERFVEVPFIKCTCTGIRFATGRPFIFRKMFGYENEYIIFENNDTSTDNYNPMGIYDFEDGVELA